MASKLWRAVSIAAAAAMVLAPVAAGADEEPARPTNPYADNAEVIPEGNSLFNQYCSHCHGPNAAQGERPRDLRRLKRRYGDDAIAMFYTTVNNGRVEKGMPVWKGVLDDDTLWKIYTFLMSVQSKK